jgi:hypothetical protein
MEGRLGVLAVVAGLLLLQSPVWGAPLPKPTHTSKTRFRIPFKFDASALKRMNAREVQLHVSQNQGETWELAQVLPPDGGKFEYVCTGEGEYWFAVKTLDGQNHVHPPRGSYDTGLIVVVDTTTPHLDLSLQQTAAGKLQARWRASDTNLDIETLRLEYLAPGSRDWMLLDVAPRARGETTWTVGQSGIVTVRGTISDAAGNIANPKVQIEVDAENYPALKQRAIPQGKIASKSQDLVDDDVGRARVDRTFTALPIPHPDDEETGSLGGNGRWAPVTANTPRSVEQFAMKPSKTKYDSGRSTVRTTPTSSDSVSANVSLPEFSTRQQIVTDHSNDDGSATANRAVSSRKKFVTSHRFQVGYKLEDVGPSGIGGVELFITEDNGRKWWKYGDDPDQKSPFDVEIPRDGEYGFAIRVRSGAGLSNDPPVPGELPAIVIAVDQTAPTVELLPIQQGQGANFNRVLIQWRVKEDHPSDKSVSLYYATSRNGPWEPISGWKEDQNGEFEWQVGRGVPVQFYVRVLIRDAAGNVGKAESVQPVVVDLSRPTAQIIDVESPDSTIPR